MSDETSKPKPFGGRPGRGPSRDPLVRLEELLDRHLIRVLTEAGEPVRDAEGKPLTDSDGKTVRSPVAPALLKVIVERIADIRAERAAIPQTPEDVKAGLVRMAEVRLMARDEASRRVGIAGLVGGVKA